MKLTKEEIAKLTEEEIKNLFFPEFETPPISGVSREKMEEINQLFRNSHEDSKDPIKPFLPFVDKDK